MASQTASPAATDIASKRPVTLITGGSAGIGRAFADMFAERRHDLFLVARDLGRLRIAADELERRWDVQVFIAAIDLTRTDAAVEVAEEVAKRGLFVEYLVNSAGLMFIGTFEESDFDGIERLLHVNMIAASQLAHLCLADMTERQCGGILNIASIAGLLPVPNMAAYSASKSFLISLTRSLAEELRRADVKVSVLVPGPVDTGFAGIEIAGFRRFVPTLSVQTVARVGFEAFMSGQTVITPGAFGLFYRFGIKLIPYKVLIRIFGFGLKKFYAG